MIGIDVPVLWFAGLEAAMMSPAVSDALPRGPCMHACIHVTTPSVEAEHQDRVEAEYQYCFEAEYQDCVHLFGSTWVSASQRCPMYGEHGGAVWHLRANIHLVDTEKLVGKSVRRHMIIR